MTDLQTILAVLPKLSKADRATVVARANALGCGAPSDNTPIERLYSTILAVEDRVGTRLPPLSVARQLRVWPKLDAASKVLFAFVDAEFGTLKHNDRRRVLAELIRCVLEGLRSRKMSVAVWSLAWGLSNVNMMVEDAYPGYRESGLLPETLLGANHVM